MNDSYSKSEDENEIDTINAKRIEYQRQMSRAKALSMTFMKSFSGLCCDGDCNHDPLKLVEAEFRSHNEEYKVDFMVKPEREPKVLDGARLGRLPL